MIRKVLIFLITGIAALIFIAVLVHAVFYSSVNDLTVPSAAHISSNKYPTNLSIPVLNIHAKVQQVGVTANGKMAVPANFTDVGWYRYGTVPGQHGSAVIDGHVDNGLAFPGVFVNLYKLKPGDDIYVTMNNNTVLHFVMTASQAYDKNYNDTNNIFNDKSGKLLKLITCTGSWLPTERTHSQRLVVTAVLKN